MKFEDLSDRDRLVLGLRFRLKHVREAIADVEGGGVPEGFDFASDDTQEAMRDELRRLETDVQRMLRDQGADESGMLN